MLWMVGLAYMVGEHRRLLIVWMVSLVYIQSYKHPQFLGTDLADSLCLGTPNISLEIKYDGWIVGYMVDSTKCYDQA